MQIKELIPKGKKERCILIVKAVAVVLLLIFVIVALKCMIPSKKYEGAEFTITDSKGIGGRYSGYIAYTTYLPCGRMRIVTTTGVVYEAYKKYIEIFKDGNYLYYGSKTR